MKKSGTLLIRCMLVLFSMIGNTVLADNYQEGAIRYFNNLPESVSVSEKPVIGELIDDVDDGGEEENHYDAILKKVIDEKRVTSQLDSSTFLSLPVGVSYGDDLSYMLVIDQASIHTDHAEFSAFMVLTNPLDNSKIRFRASNVAFSFQQGLINGIKLELIEKKKIKIQDDASLYFLGGSYVNWDCNGFKSLCINGELELSPERYVKVDPATGQEKGNVSALFSVVVSDLQNLLVDFSLEPFKIKGFEEAYFGFENVVLDFSDGMNAPGFSLPTNYPGGYSGEMANLWRGFYVKDARVYLSKKFSEKSGQPTSFYAQDLILDQYGLTGTLGANNILSIEKGKLGTWPMSISDFNMEFFTGDLKALGLKGELIVQGSQTPLAYNAFFDAAGTYHFGINPGKNISFDVFAAKVVLDGSSRIEVTVENNMFYPTAELNGHISFACSQSKDQQDKKLVNLPDLDFQGMRISTQKPCFDLDYLGFASGGQLSFNNFPVTLTEASYKKRGDTKGVFQFGMKINLIPAVDDAIIGETAIALVSNVGEGDWQFEGVEVSKIKIEAHKKGAYDLLGSILFSKGDPIYGDGFRGDINAKFGETFDVKAIAVFGKVSDFRYFFVDAMVTKNPGIPAGPFVLNGFGGGLFYRMRQALPQEASGEMGRSLSGLSYVPDKTLFMGIKAGVKGGLVNPNVVNCTVTFEILFNNGGGIRQIAFNGEASVMSPVKEVKPEEMRETTDKAAGNQKQMTKSSEVMKASISMLMDFEKDVFHSEMEVYVNVAGAITGIGANNRAGRGVMHIDRDKWYLHMGTPTDPMGLDLVGIVKVGGYFMAGHDIPDVMVMNPKVLEYLDMKNSDFNGNRSEESITTGKGLAFGANFALDTGDLTFLIFYARFELGGGFDVMLLDYGNKAYCEGRNGTVGINGWYGKGQAYAYFGGKVGIKVRVFGRRKKFDILKLQTAAAIRLEGPNPTWMKGVVGGKYRVLGGLVKGSCKFEMTVGEKCNLKTMSDLSDLEIISELTPGNDAEDIDIFTLPQAVFNMPVDKVTRISEDEQTTKTFKVRLAEYSVYQGDKLIPGSIRFDESKTTLAFTPDRIFDPKSKFKIIAKVSFDEFENGQWSQFKDESGSVYYETKEVSFSTGTLPDRIPADYIQYSYPLSRQVNFYKQEYDTAYVTFKADLEPFFKPQEGWSQRVRWTPVNGVPIYSNINYLPGKKTVETMVPEQLRNGTVYNFELVNTPLSDNNSVDRNIKENTAETVQDNGETVAEVTTREAVGEIKEAEEKAFYTIAFRSSQFNRFLDKVSGNELNVRFLYNVSPGIDLPGATIYGTEMFDKYEIYGHDNSPALIQREAVLAGADWYQSKIHPLVYEQYPLHPEASITYRDVKVYGMPPTQRIDLWQVDYDYLLTDQDVETGAVSLLADKTHFVYTLQETWSADYAHIRNKLANLTAKGVTPDSRMKAILKQYPAPQVGMGNYPIRISYTLPGRNIKTSVKVINLKNNIKTTQVNLIDNNL